MPPLKTTVSLPLLAKMLDHSLLHPTLTDQAITTGLTLSKTHAVAAACIKPYSIPLALSILANTSVKICAVIAFPAGNSTTPVKVYEAQEAVRAGAAEIDMVVNVGKVLSGEWEYVEEEIRAVNEAVVRAGGIVKVIFETDYLGSGEVVRLCEMCTRARVAFVKTSTGYGFVRDAETGTYSYRGATIPNLKLMRECCGEEVQIKAAGGVRTLDDLLRVRALGVARVGATATVEMLEEARRRGFGDEEVEVEVEVGDGDESASAGAY